MQVRRHATRSGWYFAAFVLAAASFSAAATQAAQAGCVARPVSFSASSGAEAARLKRQIAANTAFYNRHQCSPAAMTSACREITGRIGTAAKRLAKLTVSAPVASSCKSQPAEQAPAKRTRMARTEARSQSPAIARTEPSRRMARIETMCVRLSDGYFFPTPNSGYSTAADIEKIATQCRFICEDQGMDVYQRSSADADVSQMISLTTSARYSDLPQAGAYKVSASMKTCDMARFYKTVLSKTDGAELADEAPAVPLQTVAAVEAPLFGETVLRGTKGFLPAAPRKVRIVGARFLPD